MLMGCLCIRLSIPLENLTKEQFEKQSLDYVNAVLLSKFCNLILFIIDRFIKVQCPYFHQTLTGRKSFVLVISCWLVPFAFLPISLVFLKISDVLFVVISSWSMVVLLVQNTCIYILVQKQVNKIAVPSGDSGNIFRKTLNNRKMKSFYICYIIVLTWLPK